MVAVFRGLILAFGLALFAREVKSYGVPYTAYGQTATRQPQYVHAIPQARAYAPGPPLSYTVARPRSYAPSPQQRTASPVQARTSYVQSPYSAMAAPAPQRNYVQRSPAYTPGAPRSRGTYYVTPAQQIRSQTAAAAQPIRSQPAVIQQPIRSQPASIQQPIRSQSAVIQQPITTRVAQRPVTRAFTPLTHWYGQASSPYPQRGYAVQSPLRVQPTAPLIATYGRNKIPNTPRKADSHPTGSGARSSVSGNLKTSPRTTSPFTRNSVSSPSIARASPRSSVASPRISGTAPSTYGSSPTNSETSPRMNYPSTNKRNQISSSGQRLSQATQVTRNHVNDIRLPNDESLLATSTHAPIRPIPPQLDTTSRAGHRLSAFLKHVKHLQQTLEGGAMKQGLTYYDDDVTNRTRHRPPGFAAPSRKLGSQGAPGGSKVMFSSNGPQGAAQPELSAGSQPAAVPDSQAAKILRSSIPMGGHLEDPTTTQGHAGNPKVNLGLLKDKVLHSNNTHFLKRVLQVLRKYTKLMRKSMKGKNSTNTMGDQNSQQFNLEKLQKLENSEKLRNPEKFENENSQKIEKVNPKESVKSSSATLENMKSPENNANSSEKSKSENPMVSSKNFEASTNESKIPDPELGSSLADATSLTKVLGSSKNAVQIFDMLTSEASSKHGSKIAKNGGEKSEDVNASKKEFIEPERNVNTPVFSVDRLKYGLERGNTV